MGLYLCIFNEEEEDIAGIEIGSYQDFNYIRDFVTLNIEGNIPGSLFPTFIIHSDCDGQWSVQDCAKLRVEVPRMINALALLRPAPFNSEWQIKVAKSIGLIPQNAYESFIDVDGEFFFMRLQGLIEIALKRDLAILFQ